MKEYAFTETLPVLRGVDVLVAGGGPSGLAAAVAAAREGARTMLVDMNGFLGGMATAGLVGPFMTSFSPDSSRQVVMGIFEEFVQRMIARGGAIHPSQCPPGLGYSSYITRGHSNVGPFNSEIFKLEAEAMCEEAGVELLYHVMIEKAVVEEGRIARVVVATKAGLAAIEAGVFVDCTGDGDVAASAGVEMRQGRDGDGLTQPCTMFCLFDGIDKERMEQHRREHPEPDARQFSTEVERARANGDFPIERDKLGIYESCDGTWRINTTRMIGVDATDPFAVTRAEIEGRRQVQIVLDFMRKYIPGGENVRLVASGSVLGVRESRRIVGEYVLTGDDILATRSFDDSIAVYAYPIDVHQPDGKSGEFKLLAGSKPYGVPYRILLPKRGAENLLVAGRCVSATHEALGSIRVMPGCFATGQAAGVAAAMAAREGVSPKRVDVAALRAKLTAAGALVD